MSGIGITHVKSPFALCVKLLQETAMNLLTFYSTVKSAAKNVRLLVLKGKAATVLTISLQTSHL